MKDGGGGVLVGYLWPFERETNEEKKSACWFYTKLYCCDENTLKTFYKDKLCCWWAKLLHEDMSPTPTSCTPLVVPV